MQFPMALSLGGAGPTQTRLRRKRSGVFGARGCRVHILGAWENVPHVVLDFALRGFTSGDVGRRSGPEKVSASSPMRLQRHPVGPCPGTLFRAGKMSPGSWTATWARGGFRLIAHVSAAAPCWAGPRDSVCTLFWAGKMSPSVACLPGCRDIFFPRGKVSPAHCLRAEGGVMRVIPDERDPKGE